jgi:protein phosphatase methylesterase 1
MIGQMQGKFQMEVVPGVGHMLHEVRISSSSPYRLTDNYLFIFIQDDPTRLAAILVEFWKRNDRVIEGIKKVGEL